MLWCLEGKAAVVIFDAAGESVPLPFSNGTGEKGLIKPSNLDLAGGVGDFGLLEVFAEFGVDIFEVEDLRNDGGDFTVL